jgi:hypothetical protein
MLCSLEGSITCVIGSLLHCDRKGHSSIMASGREYRQAARACEPKCCARTAGIREGDVPEGRSTSLSEVCLQSGESMIQTKPQCIDFSARHPKRPSKRASGREAMKVRETKEVFGHDFVCQYLQAWLGGRQPGSSRFQDAQTRLGSGRPRGQKVLSHKYFHGAFA